jgi:hypothetical protein
MGALTFPRLSSVTPGSFTPGAASVSGCLQDRREATQ